MLTAVFRGHEQFVALAVVLSCVAGAVTFAAARRRQGRPVAWGLWGACTTATLALTLWSTGPHPLRNTVTTAAPPSPMLCASPTRAPGTWRAPAVPRSCHTSSAAWARPVAPSG